MTEKEKIEAQKAKDAEVKAKYGEVKKLEVFISENESVVGYVKKINRSTLSAALAKFESDPLLACEIILTNCLINEVSDMRLLSDDEIFMAAAPAVQGIIKLKKSSLTTL